MSLFADALIRIQADASSFERESKKTEQGLKNLEEKITGAGVAALELGGIFLGIATIITGLGAGATMAFSKFEKQMKNIEAISGLASIEMEKLWQLGLDAGRVTAASATEAALGMEKLARAGLSASQQMDVLVPIINMATAANESFDDSAQLVVRTLAAFEMDTKQANYVSDLYAKALNISQTSLVNYETAMKYIGPTAHSVGWELKDMVATLAFLYDRGIDASTAATGLRTIMLRLQSPTRETTKGIEAMGLSLHDVNPNFNSLVEIVKKFQDASAKMDIEKFRDLFGNIFGKYAFATIITMMDDTEGALQGYMDQLQNVSLYSERVASVQLESLAMKFKKLKDNIEIAGIALGESWATPLKGILDLINEAIISLNSSSSQTMKVIAGLGAVFTTFAGIIGKVLIAISATILILPTLIRNFISLKTEVFLADTALGAFASTLAGLGAIISTALISLGWLYYWWEKYVAILELTNKYQLMMEGLVAEHTAQDEMMTFLNQMISYPDSIIPRLESLKREMKDYTAEIDRAAEAITQLSGIEVPDLLKPSTWVNPFGKIDPTKMKQLQDIIDKFDLDVIIHDMGSLEGQINQIIGALNKYIAPQKAASEEAKKFKDALEDLLKSNWLKKPVIPGGMTDEELAAYKRRLKELEDTLMAMRQQEMENLEYLKREGAITSEEYIANLQDALYILTQAHGEFSQEWINIAKKIYTEQKALREKDKQELADNLQADLIIIRAYADESINTINKFWVEWEENSKETIPTIEDDFDDLFASLKKDLNYGNKQFGKFFNTLMDLSKDFTDEFTSGFSNAVTEIIVEGGKLKDFWQDLMKFMIEEVIKLLIKLALTALFEKIMSSMGDQSLDKAMGEYSFEDFSAFYEDEGGWYTKGGYKMPLEQFKGHYNVNVLPGEIMIPPQKIPQFINEVSSMTNNKYGGAIAINFNITATNGDDVIAKIKNNASEITEIIQSRMYLNG